MIGSLNGSTRQAWLKFAAEIEQAGADALELNLYEVVTDLSVPSAHIESQLVGMVEEVKRLVKIPVAVKLSPFFTATGNIARRLDEAGANGLVLFNRFYQPDIDIRTMRASPRPSCRRARNYFCASDGSRFCTQGEGFIGGERAHYIRTLHSWTR